jgi:hypothetical protein
MNNMHLCCFEIALPGSLDHGHKEEYLILVDEDTAEI